jgi:hypothetical protein
VDERKCRLQISAQVNFSKSTMMKGVIENGAQKGIKQAVQDFQGVLMPFIVRRKLSGMHIYRMARVSTLLAKDIAPHLLSAVYLLYCTAAKESQGSESSIGGNPSLLVRIGRGIVTPVPIPAVLLLVLLLAFAYLVGRVSQLSAELDQYAVCPVE